MRQNVHLELFGVDKSFKYQSVKQKLVEYLNKSGVSYSLADISDIDKFIEVGLSSVPSIRIDQKKLFSVDANGDIDATISSIFNYISDHNMNKLVVPVDFSPCSRNAADYARKLANVSGLRLELLHVHHPVVDPHNALILDPDLGSQMKEQLSIWVQEFEAVNRNGIERHVGSRFEIGYPVQTILDVAKDDATEMVVMGTLGANDVMDKLLGSNSSAVANKCTKPVLLIPPDAKYQDPKHIVVAFDEGAVDLPLIDQLITLNRPYNAHVDFVHVHESSKGDFADMRDSLMQQVFLQGNPTFSFDVHEIAATGNGVSEDIQSYCKEHKPDILVVTAKKRAFFDRIFHSSVSKQLCLHPDGPVLVMHQRKGSPL